MLQKERLPPWASMIVTMAVMPFFILPAVVIVLGVVMRPVAWIADALAQFPGGNIVATLIYIVAIITPLAACNWVYWRIYRHFRWKQVEYHDSLCLKCGYSLTGNVSGICPECGEKISLQ